MEVLLRLLAVLQNVICKLTEPVYWLLSKMEATVPLQPIRNSILSLSATQLAKKIRTGELSSEQVLHAYIFRCRRVNIKLNAVIEERYDAAVEEAEKVDELIASKTKSIEELEEETPLLGIPLTVKECCKVKGMSYSAENKDYRKKADDDGEVVGLLRKAGAIPIAVTNQSEYCLFTETYNIEHGLTKNPYNTKHTVGGSSGGEAALVSSASSVVGIGSEFIGSICCPAMYTGIFAHMPTPKIVSAKGHRPAGDNTDLKDNIFIGPMTRFAEDLPLMMRIMAGGEIAKLKLDNKVPVNSIKIYYMIQPNYSIGLPSVHKDIKLAIMKAVHYLGESCKCDIEKVSFQEFSDSTEICRTVLFKSRNLPDRFQETDSADPKKEPTILNKIQRSFIRPYMSLQYWLMKTANSLIPTEKVEYYINKKEVLKKKIIEELGQNGVLICPTYPSAAHYHCQSVMSTFSDSYSAIFTSLGLPATNVPMGLNKNGLPIGLQVVAAPYEDRLCFAVAQELEKAFGGWIQPPSLKTPLEKSD